MAETPHQFDVVVASFVLDQLESPEGLRNALIALEHLLARPPPGRPFTAATANEFPRLILASPEHAPLAHTPFEQALKQAGYEVVTHEANHVNRLTPDAKTRLVAEVGEDGLRAMEEATGKLFHVAVYAKARAADLETLQQLPARLLSIRIGQDRRRQHAEVPAVPAKNRLDATQLLVLDELAKLQPADFITDAEAVIARTVVFHDPQYELLVDRLACLIWLREQLTKREQGIVDAMDAALSRPETAFLPQAHVELVMRRPLQTEKRAGLTYTEVVQRFPYLQSQLRADRGRVRQPKMEAIYRQDLPDAMHERAIQKLDRELDQQVYTLWHVYELEERYRREHQQRSAVEEMMPFTPARRRAIQQFVADDGQAPNLTDVATHLGVTLGALTRWAERVGGDLAQLGVVSEGEMPVDRDARLAQIRAFVESYKAEHDGQAPNLTDVATHLGITQATLPQWAQRNDVDLAQQGVVIRFDHEARLAQIRAFVADFRAKHNGQAPNLTQVADHLGVTYHTLSKWLERIGMNLAGLGIMHGGVDRAHRLAQIKAFVEEFKAQHHGQAPNLTAVATYLGVGSRVLTRWAQRNDVDLAQQGVAYRSRRGSETTDAETVTGSEGSDATHTSEGGGRRSGPGAGLVLDLGTAMVLVGVLAVISPALGALGALAGWGAWQWWGRPRGGTDGYRVSTVVRRFSGGAGRASFGSGPPQEGKARQTQSN